MHVIVPCHRVFSGHGWRSSPYLFTFTCRTQWSCIHWLKSSLRLSAAETRLGTSVTLSTSAPIEMISSQGGPCYLGLFRCLWFICSSLSSSNPTSPLSPCASKDSCPATWSNYLLINNWTLALKIYGLRSRVHIQHCQSSQSLAFDPRCYGAKCISVFSNVTFRRFIKNYLCCFWHFWTKEILISDN